MPGPQMAYGAMSVRCHEEKTLDLSLPDKGVLLDDVLACADRMLSGTGPITSCASPVRGYTIRVQRQK